ncbi:PulJ/GspJ family protein [Lederbergia panacisoli]|uniref:PulJ/GspJ family protein n=1 Tax=Lederbergia panacisoli TaxID=1255251 RepID=UPI00214C3B77|nr:prepilin-type N-terminal cleavage/methylation domain-containing protein [Lederbergia panacisoli]MCR2820555.1 prepilin-type N-terminal cleavage/methylation domain-containing protein [Lederbergia panacisoli]
MKAYFKNNRGLTLVEVLLAGAIASIVFALLFGILHFATNSMKMTKVESELQQEVNLILHTLTVIHEKNSQFSFKTEDGSLTIITNEREFSFSKNYDYELLVSKINNNPKNIKVKLTIKDREYGKEISVSTILSKL